MWQYNYTDELYHHGVQGMKWGVRRDRSKIRRGRKKRPEPHEDYKRAHDRKNVKYMSDAELRERNNRLNAERQYQNLTKKKSTGGKIIGGIVAAGTTVASLLSAYETAKKVGKTMKTDGDTFADWIIKDGSLVTKRFD